MPATVIETNQTPFETVEVDPVDLDIIENALRSARHEMDAVLFRTAMSPGIREQHDEFPLVANRDGKMVSASSAPSSTPSCSITRARSRRAISSSPTIPIPATARSATRRTG